MWYAGAFQYSNKPLTHRHLSRYCFSVNTPMTDKDGKRQLVESRQREQRIYHVAETRTLDDHGRTPARKGHSCCNADPLFFTGKGQMKKILPDTGQDGLYPVAGQGEYAVNTAFPYTIYQSFFSSPQSISSSSPLDAFFDIKTGLTR